MDDAIKQAPNESIGGGMKNGDSVIGMRKDSENSSENQRFIFDLTGWDAEKALERVRDIESAQASYDAEFGQRVAGLRKSPFRVENDIMELVFLPDGKHQKHNIEYRIRSRQSIKERFSEKNFVESTDYLDGTVNIQNILEHQPIVPNGRNGCLNVFPEPRFRVSQQKIEELNSNPNLIATYITLMKHIFGKQILLGLRYLANIVQNPRQLLPVLCLVSELNATGKTTFANSLVRLLGDIVSLISMADLQSQFNPFIVSSVIVMEEVSNSKGCKDKIKNLSTARWMTLNIKHLPQVKTEVCCKLVILSNNSDSFLRADDNDIRFWVVRLNPIENWQYDFEERLDKEAEHFFNFLATLPLPIPKSRMYFSPDEIRTSALDILRENSLSDCAKDLREFIGDKLAEVGDFFATASDLTEETALRKYGTSEISRALRKELKFDAPSVVSYRDGNGASRKGRAYHFKDSEGKERENPDDKSLPF